MAFRTIKTGGLEYLTADSLSGSRHCFSTRLGGVSKGHLAGLNLGMHRGDDPENVRRNYELLGAAVGFAPEDVVFTHQIHTDIVRRVTRADCGAGLLRETDYDCDALICGEPGVALCCFSADCVPVLILDPVRRAGAAIHSGWRGSALGIAAKAVREMTEAFGSDPAELCAAIGPCIARCCFETDGDVPDAMRAALGSLAEPAIEQRGEKFHVDLKAINRIWLEQAGLRPDAIDVCPDCTACDPVRYWSHRRVGAQRGSLAGILVIPE